MSEEKSTITDETVTEGNNIWMTKLLPFLQDCHLNIIIRVNHLPPSHYSYEHARLFEVHSNFHPLNQLPYRERLSIQMTQ